MNCECDVGIDKSIETDLKMLSMFMDAMFSMLLHH